MTYQRESSIGRSALAEATTPEGKALALEVIFDQQAALFDKNKNGLIEINEAAAASHDKNLPSTARTLASFITDEYLEFKRDQRPEQITTGISKEEFHKLYPFVADKQPEVAVARTLGYGLLSTLGGGVGFLAAEVLSGPVGWGIAGGAIVGAGLGRVVDISVEAERNKARAVLRSNLMKL